MFVESSRALTPFLSSSLLRSPHGFSTRAGGVSSAAHLATLNFSTARGDTAENVRENFRRFTEAAGLPARVAVLAQVHGSDVLTLDRAAIERLPSPASGDLPAGDGLVTRERGVTLCVRVADCLPILLEDSEAGVVCALHAGWRGSVAGIAARGVMAMTRLGASCASIRAAIGPGIHECCFEVGGEVREAIASSCGEEMARRVTAEREGKLFADLPALNRALLLRAGVLPEHIDICAACTCCDPARFFSHRGSGGARGVMAAMISLPEQ